ncbi:MAG: peptidoglycan editing factor PgeF [Cognatishimia sp.]|uniref:peptidoglycan editing factor PgeF n=1 Tax=Cognatishimia sp. TaxID=2211648 RepID=UPI003B8C5C3E
MSLEILTSEHLDPLTHGFFTRKGGASSGVFAGLNCGMGSSDQSEMVTINRERVAAAMGSTNLARVHQVHSADVIVVDGPQGDAPKADAMVTSTPGVALSILTADCQPVLFADKANGVIGAAHAGWRGALDGILANTVEAMIGLGAKKENIVAVIGPTISQKAYEVGPEFFDTFSAQQPDSERFFIKGKGDRFLFDLPAFGLTCLQAAGVGTAEWIHHCTYSDPDRFFSYRRTTHNKEADYGRLISSIRL